MISTTERRAGQLPANLYDPIHGHADLAERLALIRQAERESGIKCQAATDLTLDIWERMK